MEHQILVRWVVCPSDPVTQCIILTIVRFQNGFGPIVRAKKPRLPQLQYQNHQIVHCTYLLQVSTWALKHYTNDSRLQRKLLLQKSQQLLIFRPAAKKCCVFKSLTFKMSPIFQTGCRYLCGGGNKGFYGISRPLTCSPNVFTKNESQFFTILW